MIQLELIENSFGSKCYVAASSVSVLIQSSHNENRCWLQLPDGSRLNVAASAESVAEQVEKELNGACATGQTSAQQNTDSWTSEQWYNAITKHHGKN